jgi:hypothetical protein
MASHCWNFYALNNRVDWRGKEMAMMFHTRRQVMSSLIMTASLGFPSRTVFGSTLSSSQMHGSTPDRLIQVALGEASLLTGKKRGDTMVTQRIRKYFLDLELTPPSRISTNHYSAVFISWCVRQAGVPESLFPAVYAHSDYVHAAIAKNNEESAFRVLSVKNTPPRVGDMLNMNREGGTITLKDAEHTNAFYPSETAICVSRNKSLQSGYMTAVMANDANGNVSQARFSIQKDGCLIQPRDNRFICILRLRE